MPQGDVLASARRSRCAAELPPGLLQGKKMAREGFFGRAADRPRRGIRDFWTADLDPDRRGPAPGGRGPVRLAPSAPCPGGAGGGGARAARRQRGRCRAQRLRLRDRAPPGHGFLQGHGQGGRRAGRGGDGIARGQPVAHLDDATVRKELALAEAQADLPAPLSDRDRGAPARGPAQPEPRAPAAGAGDLDPGRPRRRRRPGRLAGGAAGGRSPGGRGLPSGRSRCGARIWTTR